MRHRMVSGITGLGNPDPLLLDNQGSIPKDVEDDVISTFFQKWGGCDFKIYPGGVKFGIEPAYQYEHLFVVYVAKDKELSYWEQGVAWGAYGSEIASTTHFYKDYKYKSKFVRFVDRVHPRLVEL